MLDAHTAPRQIGHVRWLWLIVALACAAQLSEDQGALDALDALVHQSFDHEPSDTFREELSAVSETAERVRRRTTDVARGFATAARSDDPRVAARGKLRQAEALEHAVEYFLAPTVRRPAEAISDGDRLMAAFERHIRHELRPHARFFACAAVTRWEQVAAVGARAAETERREARERLRQRRRWVAVCAERVENPGRVSIMPAPGLASDEDEGFGAAEVVEAIRARLRDIQQCYERELRTNLDLAGTVRVELVVLDTGRIGSVRVLENTTGSSSVAACITDVIAAFVFSSPPDEPMTFSYPFVFAPQD